MARLPAATVALVTLITPVLALMLGAALNDELLGARVLAGAAVIVASSRFLERRGIARQGTTGTTSGPDWSNADNSRATASAPPGGGVGEASELDVAAGTSWA